MVKTMLDYIGESGKAIDHIIDNSDRLFQGFINGCINRSFDHIYLLGSGTSYNALMGIRTVVESLLDIHVTTINPEWFIDTYPLIGPTTLVIGLSHAGQSRSTIEALDYARNKGAYTIGVTGFLDAPINDHCEICVLMDSGEESVGAKTKGFFGSMTTIVMMSALLAKAKGLINSKTVDDLKARLHQCASMINENLSTSLQWFDHYQSQLTKYRRIIVTGYDGNIGALLEGTLKLVEGCRYSVVGYDQEEFMHGIYHSIDDKTLMIYLASRGRGYQRAVNLCEYIDQKHHNASIFITSKVYDGSAIPLMIKSHEDPWFKSFDYVVPLQVIAHQLSKAIGINANTSSDPNFHATMGSYVSNH